MLFRSLTPLTDLYIDETYGRLVQTNDTRTEFADGLGQAITFGTTPTGSLLTTASVSLNTITFTKGDGSTFPITVNTGSVNLNGYVTTSSFNAFTSSYNTGSFTGSFTGSLFGTASWANNATTSSYVSTLRAAGNNLEIQYNNNGVLGAASNFVYTTDSIRIGSSTIGNRNLIGPNDYGLSDVSDRIIAMVDPDTETYEYSAGN